MTLYDKWLEQIAYQERLTLALTGVALIVIAAVWLASDRQRGWLLPLAALGLVVVTVGLLDHGITTGEANLRIQPPITARLWYDEAFTAAVARLPFDRLITAVAGDVHPPLWYIIEWITVRLIGHSELALRLPALIFALLGTWLSYRVAVDAVKVENTTALLAACLLGVLPGWSYYAQEARMYTLLACAVLLAAWGLMTNRRWVMAAGMIIAVYTHNLGAAYVGTLAILYVVREQMVSVRRILPLIVVELAWLPWMAVMAQQGARVWDEFWIPDYDIGGYVLGWYRAVTGIGIPPALSIPALWVAIGLLGLAAWQAQHTLINSPDGLVFVMAITPPVGFALISEFMPIYLHRAMIPTLPFLALLVASALKQIRKPYTFVLIIALALFCLGQHKEGVNIDLAGIIEANYRGETIYHANLASYILTSYYLPEDAGYQHAVWPNAGNLSQALSLETQLAMGIPRQAARDIGTDLLVVWVETPMSTPEEVAELEAALATGRAELLVEHEHELMKLYVYRVARGGGGEEGETPGAN